MSSEIDLFSLEKCVNLDLHLFTNKFAYLDQVKLGVGGVSKSYTSDYRMIQFGICFLLLI